jgi:TetR/AcrR family transcriptional regulator
MLREAEENGASKRRIISAATEVFARRGKHGARMEEIAAAACVNKAMVYYYYSTKGSLFQAVLVAILKEVYSRVFEVLGTDTGSAPASGETMARLVSAHFVAFSENVSSAKTLLHALANEPEDLREAFHAFKSQAEASNLHMPEALLSLVQGGMNGGEIRGLDPQHTLISIIGMSLIYFIGKPIAEGLLDRKVESDETFLRDRGRNIVDLVLHGVAGERGQSPKETGDGSPSAMEIR